MSIKHRVIAGTVASLGGLLVSRLVARRQRAIDLAGRSVFITGGSRGLGLELARQSVDAGAHVAICARSRSDLKQARRTLRRRAKDQGQRVEIRTLVCDVTDRRQVQKTVKQVQRAFGTIDVLINNAGIIQVGPVEEMELREYEEALNTHFWGPLYTTEAVLPDMRAQGFGRIVNIASIGGQVSVPHLLPYSASKHALVGLSEGYRAELLKDNIYVTTVCPGLLRTGSPKHAIFKGQHRDEQTWFTISNSLSVTSMDSRDAAADILEACRYGRSTVVLSAPAQVLSTLHGVLPGVVSDTLGLVNRLLPGAGGIGTDRATGEESRSPWAPSWLTSATEKAAASNNQ